MSAASTGTPAAAVSSARAECTVDLGAVRHNIATLAARTQDSTKVWAVVKADGYGHGAIEVARAAVASGVRRLCVATLSEARQLREAGLRVPLLILGPLDALGMRRASEIDAAVAILSLDQIGTLESLATALERPLRAHLKVDTGMGRWGVPVDAAMDALARLAGCPSAHLEGLMTHFATADVDLDFARLQLSRFDPVVEAARAAHPGIVVHAANSAATVRLPESHFDAVRCGVAIYGLSPTQGDPDEFGLLPALGLRSYVADVKHVGAGDSVGYGRTFIADGPARIAQVPIGYGDGVRRALSNAVNVLIGGRPYPVVGTVSMDQLAVRVDDSVGVGDVVCLLGSQGGERVLAEAHAEASQTINYEITCGIAGEPRLRRTYTDTTAPRA